jgi:hypothetical protein
VVGSLELSDFPEGMTVIPTACISGGVRAAAPLPAADRHRDFRSQCEVGAIRHSIGREAEAGLGGACFGQCRPTVIRYGEDATSRFLGADHGGVRVILARNVLRVRKAPLPTKVVRTAPQDAASVAGLVTTEVMVAEKPEKKGPPMPPGGG